MTLLSQANEDVSKYLQQIKAVLLGDGDPLPELVAQLAQESYASDLLLHLVNALARLEFEARKDVVQVFNHLLRRQIGSRWPTVEYLCGKQDVIFATLAGCVLQSCLFLLGLIGGRYENEEIALNTGMILRDMLKHEPLAKILLYSDECVQPVSSLSCELTRP